MISCFDRQDISLVFPPLTEARLFPYLSLPILTSYLRCRGHRVQQHDANMRLAHNLFRRPNFERILCHHEPRQGTSSRFRSALTRYLLQNIAELRNAFLHKDYKHFTSDDSYRLIKQGLDLLFETSPISDPPNQIPTIFQVARTIPADLADRDDVALYELRRIVTSIANDDRPRIFAVSVAFYSQLLPAIYMCKVVKDILPDCFTILGGPQVTLFRSAISDELPKQDVVSAIGIGAGEKMLDLLAERIRCNEDPGKIRGLVLRDQVESASTFADYEDINALPLPAFDNLPIRAYMNEEFQVPLITCFGCYWGRCCFCSYGNQSLEENSYRQMSAERVADHVQSLIEKYGASRFNFVDENCNLKLISRAVSILNDRGFRIEFSTRNRLERSLTNLNFCKRLADQGCVLMSVGYETNSQRLLDKMDKGVLAEHYQQIIDNLHSVGVTLRLSVMGGLFDETHAEQDESMAFLKRNEHKIGIDVMQMLVAEPGTVLSEQPDRYGIRIEGSSELRGNDVLSFCKGRMGHDFVYIDGSDASERLNGFLGVFTNVTPQKNDEIYPPRRRPTVPQRTGSSLDNRQTCYKRYRIEQSARADTEPPRRPNAVRLKPWVAVIETRDDGTLLIANLIWQKFYRLATEPSVALDGNLLLSESSASARIFASLIDQELAEPAF